MMRLDLSAPDHTTLSRHSQHLTLRLRPVPPGESLYLVLDSTGLSTVGEGEWVVVHGVVLKPDQDVEDSVSPR